MSSKQKRTPGLVKRGEAWHIDKWVRGRRLCESTGTSERGEAERYLARRLEQLRQAEVYGIRPRRAFREAATKYLNESTHKRGIADEAMHLRQLDPFIGDLPIEGVHMGTLKAFINRAAHARGKEQNCQPGIGRKARVRAGLPFVRVHDLKHTFGRRLRAAGVSFEDRQDLLGHRSGRITTHYSAVELRNLIDAANKVQRQESRESPALLLLKRKTG